MLRGLRRTISGKPISSTFAKISIKDSLSFPNSKKFNVRAKSAAAKYFSKLLHDQDRSYSYGPNLLKISASARPWENSILLLPGRSQRGSFVPRSRSSKSRFFANLNNSLTGRRIYTALRKFYPLGYSDTRLLKSRLPFLSSDSAHALSQLIDLGRSRKLSAKRASEIRKLNNPRDVFNGLTN